MFNAYGCTLHTRNVRSALLTASNLFLYGG
ncbi:hypothetical protein HDG36_007694 [Paraburkholderia sp. Kb1A]|nr:hypothetical protein [Paraburkholderia sp. Kb1A]